MPTAVDVAERYFTALARRDLDGAVALWEPGGLDVVAGRRLVAPDGIRAYFGELFRAFPDFGIEVVAAFPDPEGNRVAVHWRLTGTFAGPGRFERLAPNGARVALEGVDLVTVTAAGRIRRGDAFLDTGELARQLGVLPPLESPTERRLTALANARTRVRQALHDSEAEMIATGVWVVRGGIPRTMNVYLLEDGDGITVFDAGIAEMTAAVARAGALKGGIRRIVLGHADADHRGVAAGLGVPVLCHPAEREAAQSPSPYRPYFDFGKLRPPGPAVFRRLLAHWDGGAVPIDGTVVEGDEVAGFTVVELPGHAPGLIGLFRAEDRLALVSDCVYTIDPETSRKGPPRVPHPAFNADTAQARASIRKLAELEPAIVWAGHAGPVSGDVAGLLARAAAV